MERFETYLRGKQIDPQSFRLGLPEEWEAYLKEYELGGEKAFDLQKKFLLNPLRLAYPNRSDK